MTGQYIVCEIKEHIPITGADKIVASSIFGETVIISKSTEVGTKGLFIDTESQLNKDLVSKLNMFRESTLNQDKSIKGYIEDNCRIRPIALKGTKCSGLFLSEQQLIEIGIVLPEKGIQGNEIDGILICEKYISKATQKAMNPNKGGKVKQNLVPTFKENIDTDQWARNSHKVQEGDLVIITEKLHGTSGRCGNLLVEKKNSWWKNWLLTLIRGRKITHSLEYEFVVGSRRIIKFVGGNEAENKQHFYEEDLWTKISKENFEGKLRKAETIYFEIVGYAPDGALIMPSVSNEKLKNFLSKKEYKDFIKKYGDVTTFTYGCTKEVTSFDTATATYNQEPEFYKIFVYRITMTNEDGDSIDYSWEQVKNRCSQMGINSVPELYVKYIPSPTDYTIHSIDYAKNFIKDKVKILTDSESKEFPQHIREGVCIRVENGNMIPLFLKNKSFNFKVLDSIIKDSNVADLEESQG